jgi:hypothetical protein
MGGAVSPTSTYVAVRVPKANGDGFTHRWLGSYFKSACRVVNKAGPYSLIECERGARVVRTAIYTEYLAPAEKPQ